MSDTAWACDLASGASASLWSLVSPATVAVVILIVGVPVYFAVNAIGRRFIGACGLPVD